MVRRHNTWSSNWPKSLRSTLGPVEPVAGSNLNLSCFIYVYAQRRTSVSFLVTAAKSSCGGNNKKAEKVSLTLLAILLPIAFCIAIIVCVAYCGWATWENCKPSNPVWKSTSASGAPDNSSLSHFSAMTRPSWLGRAVRNEHHHAIEQASRRWRGGRRGDSGRTRREFDFHTAWYRLDDARMV